MHDARAIQDLLNYTFSNTKLLEEALCAAGAPVSRSDVDGDRLGNKRLAFVGYALLQLDVANEWYPTGDSTGQSF